MGMGREERGSVSDIKNAVASGVKFRVTRWHVDSQGYDSGGSYWGVGAPLFQVEASDGNYLWFYARARDKAALKNKLRAEFPGITFTR